MATWDDVRRAALALPGTAEQVSPGGQLGWQVGEGRSAKAFVFERPLRKADLAELGEAAPAGPVLAAWVPDLGVKEALLADDPEVFFTTGHFDGYRLVLARLERLAEPVLTELVGDAWLTRAPKRLAKEFRDRRR